MAHADPTMHEHEWRPSGNLMPLSREDVIGIAVAALGTVALIMVAAITLDQDSGSYDTVTIARVLIATGALLINMAHVVGILFFESIDYHGKFQRFFARLSMLGTATALVISLAIGLL